MTQEVKQDLENKLNILREAFNANQAPDLALRKHWLRSLRSAIKQHEEELIAGMQKDFGSRSAVEIRLVELLPTMATIKENLKNMRKWSKPERRQIPWYLMPGKIRVHHQPLGVVGIITPWNYPEQLGIIPMIQALAAGNRVMLKLSEFSLETNKVTEKIIKTAFSEKEVIVIPDGDGQVGAEFSKLPFDYLFFTGSTKVGKLVMESAAKNLVPVTLELGGKSPVIIGSKANFKQAAESIAFGKGINSGQTCVAPDYILCPEDKLDDFIQALKTAFNKYWKTISGNNEYGGLIHENRYKTIYSLMDDAKQKGFKVIPLHDQEPSADMPASKQFPPVLIVNPTSEAAVMQEEIFGPLLPIISYKNIKEAVEFINKGDRPLALYHYCHDKNEQNYVLNNTQSGDMCQNDSLLHAGLDNAPFGGVGASGMGAYHGKEGFLTFTHPRTCLTRWRFDANFLMRPPYKNKPWLGWIYKIISR